MRRWMKGKTPEEMIEMMGKMMSTMMPAMMDPCSASMNPREMTSTMHEMVPKMMESCFREMTVEQRRGMLSMCRSMLDEIEEKSAKT